MEGREERKEGGSFFPFSGFQATGLMWPCLVGLGGLP